MEEWLASLTTRPAALKTSAAGAVFLLLFIGERVFAAARAPQSKARLVRNIGLWAVVLVLSPLIVAPITALGANHLLWRRPDAWADGWLLLALDVVLLDFWVYWMHRAWHRVPLLWRFHKVHHLDEFLDTTSAFRFHFGEVAVSAALRLIPVTLLAIPLVHVVIFEAIFLSVVIFHHSNLRAPAVLERTLARLIVTPSIHWVHHHAIRRDTDSNYGAIFSVWDRLFGSFSPNRRRLDMKIGVESLEDAPFLKLMLMPFLKERI